MNKKSTKHHKKGPVARKPEYVFGQKPPEEEIKDITEHLQKRAHLEKLIYDCDQSKIDEIKSLIPLFDPLIIHDILVSMARKKIFEFKFLGDLYEFAGNSNIKLLKTEYFSFYLISRKLAQSYNFKERLPQQIPSKQPSFYENPINKYSMQWYILRDDLQGFIKFIKDHNVPLDKTIKFTVNGISFSSAIAFAAFCGSRTIFRYLNAFYPFQFSEFISTNSYTIGSELTLRQYPGLYLDDYSLIHSKQNELIKTKIQTNTDFLKYHIDTSNTEIILYLLENEKIDQNKLFNMYYDAAKRSDVYLIRLFILRGFDPTQSSFYAANAFTYAKNKAIKNALTAKYPGI